MVLPLAVNADPAAATVPDASAIRPAAPATNDAAQPGSAKTNDSAKTNEGSKTNDGSTTKDASTTNDTEARRRAQRRADREAYFSAHLAALHAGLALQPDQQALWQPVESAIRDIAKARAERWRMHHQDADQGASSAKSASDPKQADAVDRLLARGENMTRMGNAIQSLAKATSPLLASLSPQQKERLPTLVEGLKPRRLIAHAFNLGDGSMDGGGRQDFGDERGQGSGLRFQQDGSHDFMRGGADHQGDQHRYGMGGGSFPQDGYGQSGALGNQQRFAPGDKGEDD